MSAISSPPFFPSSSLRLPPRRPPPHPSPSTGRGAHRGKGAGSLGRKKTQTHTLITLHIAYASPEPKCKSMCTDKFRQEGKASLPHTLVHNTGASRLGAGWPGPGWKPSPAFINPADQSCASWTHSLPGPWEEGMRVLSLDCGLSVWGKADIWARGEGQSSLGEGASWGEEQGIGLRAQPGSRVRKQWVQMVAVW